MSEQSQPIGLGVKFDLNPKNRIDMTVREEIASRVLAGMLSRTDSPEHLIMQPIFDAIWYADTLIEELERTKK